MKQKLSLNFFSYFFIFFLIFFSLNYMGTESSLETCSEVAHGENFFLQKCENLHVLTLQGTPTERAQLHGQMLKKYLSRDVFNYFSDRILKETSQKNLFIKWTASLFYNWWVNRMMSHAPTEFIDEIKAMAEGAEADFQTIKRAMALPDTASVFAALPIRGLFKTLFVMGCTSVARQSEDGNFVYGRNLEFSGTKVFDEHPLMTIQIPKEGSNELKHITFGADGVQFGGITGVNEAGIAIAIHQLVTSDSDSFGVPMIFVGELVLRQAKTLDEAQEIINKNRPGPMWVFVLADINRKEARALEVSAKYLNARKMETNIFGQTNHIMGPEQQKDFASQGWIDNSHFRENMTRSLISQDKSVTAESAAKVLSFQSNQQGQLTANRDILKAITIQSVIFENKNSIKKIFVSFESAPTSSGKFAEFQWQQLFAASPKGTNSKLEFIVQNLSHTPPEVRDNQKKLAHVAWLSEEKKYFELTEFLKDHPTASAKLMRATAFLNLEKYSEAQALIEENRHRTDLTPTEVKSGHWLELFIKVRTHQDIEAKQMAKNLESLYSDDHEFHVILHKIALGEDLGMFEKSVNFSIFSGGVSSHLF